MIRSSEAIPLRSVIAALRTLVLPFGATSGRRIILDGINGVIQDFDSNGDKRIELGETPGNIAGLRFYSTDPGETFPGTITGDFSTNPIHELELTLFSPAFAQGNLGPTGVSGVSSLLSLQSQSADGNTPSEAHIRAGLLSIVAANGGDTPNDLADLTLNGESLKFHKGTFDQNTAGDGKLTITHGAGFTPSAVVMVNDQLDDATGVAWWMTQTGSYTGTTFRAQFRSNVGAAVVSSRVRGKYICYP
jgi:hypothetical protein